MARRFVHSSWNNAAAVKAPKPVPPLRYRISPVEKHFDDLDSLASELQREFDAGKMEAEEHAYLCDVLAQRRGGLTVKRRKAVGETIQKARPAPRAATQRMQGSRPVRAKAQARRSPLETKLMIVGAILLYFFLKSV